MTFRSLPVARPGNSGLEEREREHIACHVSAAAAAGNPRASVGANVREGRRRESAGVKKLWQVTLPSNIETCRPNAFRESHNLTFYLDGMNMQWHSPKAPRLWSCWVWERQSLLPPFLATGSSPTVLPCQVNSLQMPFMMKFLNKRIEETSVLVC